MPVPPLRQQQVPAKAGGTHNGGDGPTPAPRTIWRNAGTVSLCGPCCVQRVQPAGAWDKAAGAMVQISHRCASIVFTVLFVLAGIVLAVVPLGLWMYWDDTVYRPDKYSKLALLVASCFLGVTLPISLWDIVMHLRYMHTPLLQVPIVRVLWMVPIYSVDSWLALRFSTSRPQVSMYICVARECYEAFVVYNFFLYLARYVAITAVRDRDWRRTPRGQGSFGHEAADAVHGDSRVTLQSDTGAGSETVRPAHGVPDDGSSSYVLDVSRASSGPAPSQVGEGGGESVSWQRGAEGLADVRRVEARIKFLLARKPPIQHIWPLTQVLRPWSTASSAHHASCEYYRRVKGGVTQYVVVKLAGALVAFVLKPLNLWGEGSLDPLTGFFWVANATNLSQGWALYCLVLFFKVCVGACMLLPRALLQGVCGCILSPCSSCIHIYVYCLMLFFKGLRHELAPMKPLGKFMAVKALVFFSFWQSLGIAVLVNTGLIKPSEMCDNCQPAQLAAATQDFLICIEMLVFSMVRRAACLVCIQMYATSRRVSSPWSTMRVWVWMFSVGVDVYMYVCICMYTHTQTHTHTRTYTYTYIHQLDMYINQTYVYI